MPNKLLAPLLAALALSACGSLGGILGGPGSNTPSDSGQTNSTRADLRGTVVDVDTAARRITLDADSSESRTNLRPQRGEHTVYYDERTVVEFGGETYRPESLERGDEVDVRFARQANRDLAERITVVRDVRAGGGVGYDDDPTVVRGTVGNVYDADRRIDVDSPYDDRRSTPVYYDDRTVVIFEGREHEPENLERGDEISVTGQRRDNRFVADRITVERDVRAGSGGSYDDDRDSDVRGTVRSLSTRDRLIELDLAWGERGEERVYYDDRTVVDLDGRPLRPDRLLAGDEISVSGTRRNNRFVADSIRVLREASRSER